jgi:hypothetical protein
MQQASQPAYHPSSDLERKLRRMTILVGMVGSDGIILAADQRLTQPAQDEKQFDQHDGICKIVNVEKHKIAYARVGDYASRTVGDRIVTTLDSDAFGAFDYSNIRLSLIDIAEATIKDENAKLPPYHFNPQRGSLVANCVLRVTRTATLETVD